MSELFVGDPQLARAAQDCVLDGALRATNNGTAPFGLQRYNQGARLEGGVFDIDRRAIGPATAGRRAITCHDHACEGVNRLNGKEAEHFERRVPEVFVYCHLRVSVLGLENVEDRAAVGGPLERVPDITTFTVGFCIAGNKGIARCATATTTCGDGGKSDECDADIENTLISHGLARLLHFLCPTQGAAQGQDNIAFSRVAPARAIAEKRERCDGRSA